VEVDSIKSGIIRITSARKGCRVVVRVGVNERVAVVVGLIETESEAMGEMDADLVLEIDSSGEWLKDKDFVALSEYEDEITLVRDAVFVGLEVTEFEGLMVATSEMVFVVDIL